MHALAGQGIEVCCKSRCQRLAFTSLLFGDVALMQENSAHQLGVEGPKPQCPARAFTTICKGFGQQVVEALAPFGPARELLRLFLDLVVAELFEIRFERVDLINQRACRLDFAVVRRAEDLFGDCSDTQHVLSRRTSDVLRRSACPAPSRSLSKWGTGARAAPIGRCKGRTKRCQCGSP